MFSSIRDKIKSLFGPSKLNTNTWQSKRVEFADIYKKVPNGSHIFIGSTAATARKTLNSIVNAEVSLLDINVVQFTPIGSLPHLEKHNSQFRTTSFYAYRKVADKVEQGVADYTPISTAKLHRLIKDRHIPIDVAVVKLTPPNKDGWCNLGIGVDLSIDAVRNAKIVIAEICEHMPWTMGEALIHTSEIHWWTEHHKPIPTSDELLPFLNIPPADPKVLDKLAANVLFEIPDGATLKFDISIFTNNLVPYLKRKKNLGLYTDLLNDQLLKLIKAGVINNSQKNIDNGKSIVCHAYGSKELYDYIDKNPNIEFRSSYRLNRLDKLARQDNLIYLLSGLKVDLSGQVAVDSIGSRLYGGIGSADDSIRGAGYSRGGKPIVAIASRSPKGNSNIMLALPEGTGVAITRLDVHYIITEYGTAFLFGKSLRERCLALIDIAHPEFREQLLTQAKNLGFIHSEQLGHSFTSQYPKQWEQIHQTKKGREILIRPIKALDEDRLRDFFHHQSDHNVYMRYFTQMRSLPQKVLKNYTDIDYSKDMALVALSPPRTAQHEIVGIAQWISSSDDDIPEIAFQISDEWQGEGLGAYFFEKLIEIASDYGITKLKADVLQENRFMNSIIENASVRFERKLTFGVYCYIFDVTQQNSNLTANL